jgi:hypothetical protein
LRRPCHGISGRNDTFRLVNDRIDARLPGGYAHKKAPGGSGPPGACYARGIQRLVLLELRRPPPWLALPPLLAISRCFAGSIAANPRFDPLLLVTAMVSSVVHYQL